MITRILRIPISDGKRVMASRRVHITDGPLKGKKGEYIRTKCDRQTGEMYFIVALNREPSQA